MVPETTTFRPDLSGIYRQQCVIEFRSFSKTVGFTGVRCGYTVVPKELTAATLERRTHPVEQA